MKLSVPCTWEESLLDDVCRLNDSGPRHPVFEFYGSLKASWVGSCHSAASIRGDCRSKKRVEAFIKKIHQRGLKFNYTINSSCLGNKEYTYKNKKKIIKELKWIISLSDSVTVSIPLLMEMVRKLAGDGIEIVVSTIVGIDSPRRIEFFQELGADRIVLNIALNRNLPKIKETRKKTPVKLELLVNDSCLYQCPYRNYHYNTGSHGSRRNSLFYLDYCVFKCTLKRLQHPEEILKSPWLRPEDLEYYRGNIDIIKIAGREKSTPWVLRAVEAYARAAYQGNILDLLTIVTPASHELGEYFLGESPSFFLDNRDLAPYMRSFFSGAKNCFDCSACNYCKDFADKHLVYEKNEVHHYAQQLKTFGESLFSPNHKMNIFKFLFLKFLFLNFVKDTIFWRKNRTFFKKMIQRRMV